MAHIAMKRGRVNGPYRACEGLPAARALRDKQSRRVLTVVLVCQSWMGFENRIPDSKMWRS